MAHCCSWIVSRVSLSSMIHSDRVLPADHSAAHFTYFRRPHGPAHALSQSEWELSSCQPFRAVLTSYTNDAWPNDWWAISCNPYVNEYFAVQMNHHVHSYMGEMGLSLSWHHLKDVSCCSPELLGLITTRVVGAGLFCVSSAVSMTSQFHTPSWFCG